MYGGHLGRGRFIRYLLAAGLGGWIGLLATPAEGANKPCSGRKGGIAHCQGDTFVCNDGSVSASRKSCQAYMGGTMQRLMPAAPFAKGNGACGCREGKYCVGPRGGRYCITDGGGKSYLRK